MKKLMGIILLISTMIFAQSFSIRPVYAYYYMAMTTDNCAVGYSALAGKTTGTGNVAVGNWAGYSITTQSNNTFLGFSAGASSTGTGNVFLGYESGYYNTTPHSSTFVGYQSGRGATTGCTGIANSMFGYTSGVLLANGSCNSMFGFSSGAALTSGGYNAAFGYNSGLKINTGVLNTMFGALSGNDLTSGRNNVFLGYNAGDGYTTENNKFELRSDYYVNVQRLAYGDFADSSLVATGDLTIGKSLFFNNGTSIVPSSGIVTINNVLTLTPITTANRPATPAEGMMYMDSTTGKPTVYIGGAWYIFDLTVEP